MNADRTLLVNRPHQSLIHDRHKRQRADDVPKLEVDAAAIKQPEPDVSTEMESSELEAVVPISADGSVFLASHGVSDKGPKQYQQDRRVILTDLRRIAPTLPAGRFAFFAVYDGHGGHHASEYLRENLHLDILERLSKCSHTEWSSDDCRPTIIKDTLINAYRHTDKTFLADTQYEDGSVAVTALVVDKEVWVANVGDSKAVLARVKKDGSGEVRAIRLTKDHNPMIAEERKRVEKRGGFVEDGRVGGVLGVTRAFGDSKIKRLGLSVVPDIAKFSIHGAGSTDLFMLLGCDGLWSVFNPDGAVKFVRNALEDCARDRTKYGSVKHRTPEEQTQADARAVCLRLVEEATLVRKAQDNVTAVIVMFDYSPGARALKQELQGPIVAV